ncbi:MAG: hypothetical protein NDJ18_00240 [candidate division Zixibacteria bacterium]|nr:hypothetical protein [candidate division Zixibacteria bacterium]
MDDLDKETRRRCAHAESRVPSQFSAKVHIDRTGVRSIRIRSADSLSGEQGRSELVVPQSQAYQFMEMVIHVVAEMERRRK